MEESSEPPRRDPRSARRDPNKAKKHPFSRPPQQQQRPPVIIYTDSPTVVHTSPSEFMSTVQRLTGSSSSSEHERTSDVDDQHRGGATSVEAVALAPLPESLVDMSSDCFSASVDRGNAQYSSFSHQFSVGCSTSHAIAADDAFFASPANNLLPTPPIVSSSPADYWDPFDHDQDQV